MTIKELEVEIVDLKSKQSTTTEQITSLTQMVTQMQTNLAILTEEVGIGFSKNNWKQHITNSIPTTAIDHTFGTSSL